MGLWLLWLWVPLGFAEEEVLLDTRLETSDLNWTVYPAGEGQWEELSALDPELGAPVRTFEVCSGRGRGPAPSGPAPSGPAQNSWLRSRWVPRGGAAHVFAELRFTMLACDGPAPRRAPGPAHGPAHGRAWRRARHAHGPSQWDAAPGHRPGNGHAPGNHDVHGNGPGNRSFLGDGLSNGPGGDGFLSNGPGNGPGGDGFLSNGPGDGHGNDGFLGNGLSDRDAPRPAPLLGGPSPRGPSPRCRETFTVFLHESDGDTATPLSPPWLENPYVRVDTVAADHLAPRAGSRSGSRPRSPAGQINRKTLRLGPLSRAGFYLAFQDLGACLALLSVRLSFRRCPALTRALARFPATVPRAPVAAVAGRCLQGAVARGGVLGPPVMYCREDGTWAEPPPAIGCVCGPGWEPRGGGCAACPPGWFQGGAGGGPCLPCPPHSRSPSPAAAACECEPGTFRDPGGGAGEPCWEPPSAPQGLWGGPERSGVRLAWGPPRRGAGHPELSFVVTCQRCPPGGGPCGSCPALRLAPPPPLRGHGVTVSGLTPGVTYRFRVSARSGVSGLGPQPLPHSEVNVTAGGDVPPPVGAVTLAGGSPSAVTLTWPPPPHPPPGGPILDYEVKYYEKGPPMFLKVPEPRAELGGLRRGGLYGVRVRARSDGGYGAFGPETAVTPPASDGGSRGVPVALLGGAAALGGLLVLAALGGALLSRRHCQRREDPERHPRGHGGSAYIDPLSYEDPRVVLGDVAPELDGACVTLQGLIGTGEFGQVHRGLLTLPGSRPSPVAVKTLRGGVGEGPRRDLLREAARMGQFRHPHVLRLRGVVTAGDTVMMVTELMDNGALDAFLRGREGTLGTPVLVSMLRGVAGGMQYLSSLGFVHRDLAARNVLVDARLVCKVSDFGLARATAPQGPDATYTSTAGGKIPVRWTAPEALARRSFSWASDVWSFGVVMWEVLSFGERPYWDMDNQAVLRALDRGYRLPRPPRCPPALHRLMLRCWRRRPRARPRFRQLLRALRSPPRPSPTGTLSLELRPNNGAWPRDDSESDHEGAPPAAR
ncbi:ephrin type-B receptor 4-like isoform X1 [Patagioenas fasciata]|uniref:ephrin type-B receptor 4-like isoform X1 n=1 Tax=Patagioenas fasciata TaxID=372321 RepID=UPI003A99B82F